MPLNLQDSSRRWSSNGLREDTGRPEPPENVAAGVFTYRSARRAMIEGRWHPGYDAMRVILLDSSYQPDDSHQTYADVASFEIEAPGYSKRGLPIPGIRIEEGEKFDLLAGDTVAIKLPPMTKAVFTVVIVESDGTLIVGQACPITPVGAQYLECTFPTGIMRLM